MSGRTRRGRNPLFFPHFFWRKARASALEKPPAAASAPKAAGARKPRRTPLLLRPPRQAFINAARESHALTSAFRRAAARRQRSASTPLRGREGILCAAQQSRASNPACARSERAGTFKSAGRARLAESKRRPAETSRAAMSSAGPACAPRVCGANLSHC